MTCENCIVCSTPVKIKGLIISGLLVGCAIATSILTFTTNCERVIHFSNNQTQTINDIGTANKVVSMSLLAFSVSSAIFERYINKKLTSTIEENEDLKTEIAMSRNCNNSNRDDCYTNNNEPTHNILSTPSPVTPDTNRSIETYYPSALNLGRG
jgi:hypothetical protein